MKNIRFNCLIALFGGLLTFSGVAQAQGTLFVTGDKVGIGIDTPTELLHLKVASGPDLKMRLEQSANNAWAYAVIENNVQRPNSFRISKQGSGGPEVDIIGRFDPGGQPTMLVDGSIQATNVTFSSSRELKTDFRAIDSTDMLNRVSQLEMGSWQYKQGSPGKHIGPVAEDFEKVFELGTNGKTISVVDANGIALAAIQGLYVEVQKRDMAIESLAAQLADLQGQIDSLSER